MAHNLSQRMCPPATVSNTLSGSIICPSVRPFVQSSVSLFAIFLFVKISSEGIQGVAMHLSPHWGPVELTCSYIHLPVRSSVSLFGYHLCNTKIEFSTYSRRSWVQISMNVSIICPYVRLSGRLSVEILQFLYLY